MSQETNEEWFNNDGSKCPMCDLDPCSCWMMREPSYFKGHCCLGPLDELNLCFYCSSQRCGCDEDGCTDFKNLHYYGPRNKENGVYEIKGLIINGVLTDCGTFSTNKRKCPSCEEGYIMCAQCEIGITNFHLDCDN